MMVSFQICDLALLQKTVTLQCHNALDPLHTAEQQLGRLLNRIVSRDQRTQCLWPALLKDTEIANRSLKSSPVSVNRAEDHLILEHRIQDHAIGINVDGSLAIRHTCEGE